MSGKKNIEIVFEDNEGKDIGKVVSKFFKDKAMEEGNVFYEMFVARCNDLYEKIEPDIASKAYEDTYRILKGDYDL